MLVDMRSSARPRFRSPLLVAALAAAACSDAATGSADGITVATAVAPTAFRTGDSATVTVTVTNMGSRTRSFFASGCLDPFDVIAADGTVLPAGARLCLDVLQLQQPLEVTPGKTRVFTRAWRGDYGEKFGNGLHGLGALLSPGTYMVRGFVDVANGTRVVSAAPATIQIQAR